ncbi:MAG TPA: type III-B CRISPR module RAMP protein Cmr4 [Desulfotomaculum sp.]|nr:type III-B CRISPR module RAMP protein Cmr4 [Desulfotomaculum sp.]
MKYFALSLDPIHVGAGGYRLGRVDNTIVREPATDVPKIPGTSLAGAVREYTTIWLKEKSDECKNKNKKEKEECALRKANEYFGDKTRQGVVRFYDAQIILFPVTSINGTVWITTKAILEGWMKEEGEQNDEKIKIPQDAKNEAYIIKWDEDQPGTLNLGWLLLKVKKMPDNDNQETVKLPAKLNFIKRIAVVSDKLFSHLVNDNLEVRTSVRIDSETGAAAEGALFTYEAIPRGTVFGFEMAVDDRRRTEGESDIIEKIKNAFIYLKMLGIGGMGTRGFGRLEVLRSDAGNKQDEEGGGAK